MTRPSDILTREERQRLTQKSDLQAWWLVLSTWAVIFGLLALAGFFPSVLTILLVFVVLPGRQLSLAVLMHEAGHGTLFATPALNRWVGQWLCALPTLGDLHSYAEGHLEHHRKAGTPEDPDLPNYAAYPVSAESFRRKVIRDLTGQTGAKLLAAIFGGATGIVGDGQRRGSSLLVKQLGAQLVLFGVLQVVGIGWTWLLWFATFMTTYMLVIRFRQVAEHASVPNLFDLDPRQNTRTVDAPYWQLFLIAPSFVNFHMEHHFMAGVPCYHLPELRRILRSRGYLDEVEHFTSYRQVYAAAIQTPIQASSG